VSLLVVEDGKFIQDFLNRAVGNLFDNELKYLPDVGIPDRD
jgi:hypothetical protein